MIEKPSLVNRIAIGKGAGMCFGLLGLITLPYFVPDTSWMERFGILFWYTTMGAFIGVFGVFNWHPILHLPMPWWFRSVWIGGWMNFVLTLLMYERMNEIMLAMMGADGFLRSPFWFVAEGAVVGLVIGYLATLFAGEGPETVGA